MVWLKFCPSTGANGGEKGKVTVTLSELPVGTVAGLKTEVIKQVNSAFNEIRKFVGILC